MHYTYVLQSLEDKNYYVGYTKDLKLRFEQHSEGRVNSTKDRRPLKLIYYEACINKGDAIKREKYLKTHYGRMYLKKRLKSYFTGVAPCLWPLA
jgi:putative endonuclease